MTVTTSVPQTISVTPDESSIRDWLQPQLSDKAFQSALATQQRAIELCYGFQLDAQTTQQVRIACLLCAPFETTLTADLILEQAIALNLAVSDEDYAHPQHLLPMIRATQLAQQYPNLPVDILNTVRYQWTGRSEMSVVETLCFIAIKLEENRKNPLFSQRVMDLIRYPDRASLDEMMLYLLNAAIQYALDAQESIHSRLIAARNDRLARVQLLHQTQRREPITAKRRPTV